MSTKKQPTQERLRKLVRTYALLSGINQAIVRVREPQALYEIACRLAIDPGGFQLAWIGLLDEQTGQVRTAAQAGAAQNYLEQLNININDSHSGQGPIATAIRTGAQSVVNDIASDPRMLPWRAAALQEGCQSLASFPLIVLGQTRGSLNLYASTSNFFDQDELKLLAEMTSDLAFALEFAEQEEKRKLADQQLSAQAARLQILANASKEFSAAGPNYQAVLHQVVQQVGAALADMCQIRLVSSDAEQLELVAIYSQDPEQARLLQTERLNKPFVSTSDPGLASHVIRTGQPALVPIVTSEQLRALIPPQDWEKYQRFAPHSYMIVPLLVKEQSIGILVLARIRPDLPAFTQDDLSLAQDLATRAALVITNAQLFAQAQNELTERKRAEKQIVQMQRLYATLSQVNQTIVRVKDHADLYQSICDLAVKFGEFSLAWIGLLNEATGEVKPVAATGLDLAHWPFDTVNIKKGKLKTGLAATAVRTARVVTSEDIETDDRTKSLLLQQQLLEYNYHSSAAVPFRLRNKTIGVLALVSTEVGLFNAREEVLLLEEMGLDISFALDTMETEAQRQQADAERLAGITRLDAALESMTDAVFISDVDGRFINFNHAFATFHKFRNKDECAKTLAEYPEFLDVFMPNGDLAPLEQWVVPRALRGETGSGVEYSLRRKDTGQTWVGSYSFAPIRDTHSAIVGSVVVARDITARKQFEQALQHSDEALKKAQQVAHVGSWIWHIPENRLEWSDEMYQIFGIDKQTFSGQLADVIASAIHPDDRASVEQANLAVIQHHAPVPLEYRLVRGDGSVRTVWAEAGELIQDDQGQALRLTGIVQDITERKLSEQKIKRQLDYLTALREIDRVITSTFDMHLSLTTLLARTLALLSVDAAAILLLEPGLNRLEFAAGLGFQTGAVETARVRLGEGHAGRVALERRLIKIPDLSKEPDDLLLSTQLQEEKFVSYYGVPLIVKSKVIGVLEVFQRAPLARDQEWLDFLETLAGQAAIAIDSAQLFVGMQQSNMELAVAYDATIEGWSRAMDLRDKETEGHTLRVTELTIQLARAAGLGPEEIVHIRRGALLHDMGKLGVPDGILFKPGDLTGEEQAVMRMHPQYAFDMLASIKYLRPVLDIPYCHHEKFDGTGYPRGLKGAQIPLAARLFTIIDVWDALRSDRPYRVGWPEEKVMAYLRAQSGKHFDPQIVDLFFRTRSA